MNINELRSEAYSALVSKKKKGAGKGYKYSYTTIWSGRMTRREYLTEFEAIDRKSCGLFLCKLEFSEMEDDRWWDVPNYRDEAVKRYRNRIKEIRMNYGLSKSEVAEFMSVA